jgi:hypothetical protein
MWRSVLLVEETKAPGENHRHVALLSYILTITDQVMKVIFSIPDEGYFEHT